jgi:hypothetical protein
MTSWHVDDDLLDAYARSALPPAAAWSIEAHLPQCGPCRRRITPYADTARVDAVRARLVQVVDAPKRSTAQRLLIRLGVREHTVRLLLATPSLRASWLTAVAIVLALAVTAAYADTSGQALLVFLALAPVAPLAGVATAYGAHIDPIHEITVAAPISGFRLLLLRAVAVLTSTILMVGLATLALPGADVRTAAWLLPALALATGSLALSPLLGPVTAASGVGAVWIVAVVVTAAPETAEALPFSAAGQLGSLLLAAVAAGVLFLQRRSVDRGDQHVLWRIR